MKNLISLVSFEVLQIVLALAMSFAIWMLPGSTRSRFKNSKKENHEMSSPKIENKRVVLICSLLFVSVVFSAIGFFAGSGFGLIDMSTIPFHWIATIAVPVLVLILAVLVIDRMLNQSKEGWDTCDEKHAELKDSLIENVRQVLTPNIHIISGEPLVMIESTRMISSATTNRNPLRIYGIPNLIGVADRQDQTPEILEIRDEYRSSRSFAHTQQIPVTRFLSFDTPTSFALRAPEDQQMYLKWVKSQVPLMERNSGYEIYNSMFAPKFGASSHAISTDDSMVLMVGNGSVALKIKGESIVEPFQHNWTRMFEGKAGKPELYDLEKMERYIERVQELPPSVTSFAGEELIYAIIAQLEQVDNNDGRIVYNGAGGFSTLKCEVSGDVLRRYESLLQDLQQKKVPFERYIKLIPVEEFTERGDEFKERYLVWLEKQIQLLKEYSEYKFYDAKRAASFESLENRIFMPGGYFQIMGSGLRGVFVSGEGLAKEQEEGTRKTFHTIAKNPPQLYTANRLQKYFDSLTQIKAKTTPRRRVKKSKSPTQR